MKRFKIALLPVFVLAIVFTTKAQAPKDGILIKLDQTELSLADGKASTKIMYVRSKRLSKVKLEAPVVQSTQGLEVDIEQVEGEKDTFLLTVTATEAIVSNMTLIVDGAGRWKHKMKSATFTIMTGEQVTKN